MEVDTSGYPHPLREMRGTWAVEDDPGRTRIRLRYDFQLNHGFAGRVLGALMRSAFARTCRQMLDSYEAALRVVPAIQLDGR
jgi:ribosome-associated toxin RatA of RatAB toxin-antitoxin module